MEATAERKTFDKVIGKLKWIGGCLENALYCGGLRLGGLDEAPLSIEDSLNKIKAEMKELNQIEISDFIGSWLKIPENHSLLKVWIGEILNNTYNYHKEVEKANYKPEQIGWEEIAENYDRWRNTIIFHLSKCLPDGVAVNFDGKKYVVTEADSKKRKFNDEAVKTSFKECLWVEDKDDLLAMLHKMIDGKKGKVVANIISVCMENGLMEKPTYTQVKEEFGEIGNKSGYNKYMALGMDFKEKKPIENALKEFI